MLTFYKNKKVLITGDTGFKGTWLSLILHDAGANVLGVSDEPPRTNDSFFNMIHLDEMITHRNVDVRNFNHLQEVFTDFQPDIVFHLAAQPLVRTSYEEPRSTMDINVMGSVNILECVRLSTSVKSFILVTTDKVYKDKDSFWGYRECDELGGVDPYSASKSMVETAFTSYYRSFFSAREIGVATARGGNVIGGGDFSKDRIIPDCFRSLLQGNAVVLRNPTSVRPWQHVLELLDGYLKLGICLYNNPSFSGNWNFGPTLESFLEVEAIVKMFLSTRGSGAFIVNSSSQGMKESHTLTLDSTKSNKLLEWRPRMNVREVMRLTALWYRKVCVDKANPLDFSRSQIKEFFK
jgi:CDP-glucose 4,6-dehydratase